MVRINGNDVAAAEQNLQAFLEKEGYRCDRIAIELNGTIVPRRTYADCNPPRWRFYGNRPFQRQVAADTDNIRLFHSIL